MHWNDECKRKTKLKQIQQKFRIECKNQMKTTNRCQNGFSLMILDLVFFYFHFMWTEMQRISLFAHSIKIDSGCIYVMYINKLATLNICTIQKINREKAASSIYKKRVRFAKENIFFLLERIERRTKNMSNSIEKLSLLAIYIVRTASILVVLGDFWLRLNRSLQARMMCFFLLP